MGKRGLLIRYHELDGIASRCLRDILLGLQSGETGRWVLRDGHGNNKVISLAVAGNIKVWEQEWEMWRKHSFRIDDCNSTKSNEAPLVQLPTLLT